MRTLDELSLLGTKSINWTGGGEPTLHKGFSAALAHSYSLGLENGLISNFSQIKEEYDDQILDQLIWTRVSMAGGTAEKYREIQGVNDFDKVIRNLTRVCQKRTERKSSMNLGIAMMVKPGNLLSVPEMVKRALDIGVDYVQLRGDMFMSEPEKIWWNKQAYPIIQQAVEMADGTGLEIVGAKYIETQQFLEYPSKCHAHHFVLGINAEGYVAFCKNTRDNPKFYLGNLKEQSFTKIWETSTTAHELEQTVTPVNCATFCKNMGINKAIEDVIQGTTSLSSIPLSASETPETINFL